MVTTKGELERNSLRVLHLNWEGPVSFSDLPGFEGPKDKGVYQIYGNHTVYGADTLLYIGRTAGDQRFAWRIPTHPETQPDWGGPSGPFTVYFGRVWGPSKHWKGRRPTDEVWDQWIDQAERLLIHAHKPAWNMTNVRNTKTEDLKDLLILHWGTYGRLLPEVSGVRWSYEDDGDDFNADQPDR